MKRLIRRFAGPLVRPWLRSRELRALNKVYPAVAGRGGRQRALLSYITSPFFTRDAVQHSNVIEARTWAAVLAECGYEVDAVHYLATPKIVYDRYDAVCGFGEPVEQSWGMAGPAAKKRLVYATGCYTHFSNHASLARLHAYHHDTSVWALRAGRIVSSAWPVQVMLAELLVVLGNQFTLSTYTPWRLHGRSECLDAFYLSSGEFPPDPRPGEGRDGILWFGSSGCIHKGLHLVLEALRHLPHARLHVCGADFLELTATRLSEVYTDVWSRVHIHGHLLIGSAKLREVLAACAVVVHPSASEGGSPSVLTAVANGSLIPIIAQEDGLNLPPPAVSAPNTADGIASAIRLVMSAGDKELVAMRQEAAAFVRKHFSYQEYRKRLSSLVRSALKN